MSRMSDCITIYGMLLQKGMDKHCVPQGSMIFSTTSLVLVKMDLMLWWIMLKSNPWIRNLALMCIERWSNKLFPDIFFNDQFKVLCRLSATEAECQSYSIQMWGPMVEKDIPRASAC